MIELVAELAWGLAVIYAVAGTVGIVLGLVQIVVIQIAAAIWSSPRREERDARNG